MRAVPHRQAVLIKQVYEADQRDVQRDGLGSKPKLPAVNADAPGCDLVAQTRVERVRLKRLTCFVDATGSLAAAGESRSRLCADPKPRS